MKKLITFIAALSAAIYGPASAAEIKMDELPNGVPLIVIEGEITEGDSARFRRYADNNPKALIVLAGPGGSLGEALEIGRTIQKGDYGTYILSDFPCASACALIWLAGNHRIVEPNSLVGFHSGYVEEDGVPVTSGFANAMIGRYLSLLSLSDKATFFITGSPPDGMYWLDTQSPGIEGISYEVIAFDHLLSSIATPTLSIAQKAGSRTSVPSQQQNPPYSSAQAIPSIPDRTFGKWTALGNVAEYGGFGLRSETRSDGTTLGFVCQSARNCDMAIRTPLSCDPGDSYTITFLANGTHRVSAFCHDDGRLLQSQIPPNFIENIISLRTIEMEVTGDISSWNIPFSMSGFREAVSYLTEGGLLNQ